MITLTQISFQKGDAFIQGDGEPTRFNSTEELLRHLGCKVEERPPVIFKCQDWKVPIQYYNVEFPEGSAHLKRPRAGSSLYTASGRRKKNPPKNPKPPDPKGMICIPGDDCDYVVTYYEAKGESPHKLVPIIQEVEKE